MVDAFLLLSEHPFILAFVTSRKQIFVRKLQNREWQKRQRSCVVSSGAGKHFRVSHWEAGIRGHYPASATPASEVCGQEHGFVGYLKAPHPWNSKAQQNHVLDTTAAPRRGRPGACSWVNVLTQPSMGVRRAMTHFDFCSRVFHDNIGSTSAKDERVPNAITRLFLQEW